MNKGCKISIRITPYQEQVLQEMSQTLGTSYSMLIRTILGDWLTKNEEYIYRIIDKKKIENADYQQTGEEEETFAEEGDRYEETETDRISEQALEEIARNLFKGAPDM